MLELIKAYFGVGGIYKNGSVYNYEVGSYNMCFEYILPFFTEYPLPSVCLKAFHFGMWKEGLEIMYSGKHLTCKKLYVNKLILRINKYKSDNDN